MELVRKLIEKHKVANMLGNTFTECGCHLESPTVPYRLRRLLMGSEDLLKDWRECNFISQHLFGEISLKTLDRFVFSKTKSIVAAGNFRSAPSARLQPSPPCPAQVPDCAESDAGRYL